MGPNPGIRPVNPAWPWMGSAATPPGLDGSSGPGSGGVDWLHHRLHRAIRPEWMGGTLVLRSTFAEPHGGFRLDRLLLRHPPTSQRLGRLIARPVQATVLTEEPTPFYCPGFRGMPTPFPSAPRRCGSVVEGPASARDCGRETNWEGPWHAAEDNDGGAIRRYPAKSRQTRGSPALMPCGRATSQVRRESSTCISMVARTGGWSPGDSTNRKSGPNCAMRKLVPFTSSRIRTNAECPP